MQEYLQQQQEVMNADIQTHMQEEAQRQQVENLKRVLFLKRLTKDARDRLSNIRMANPQFAEQVELILIQLIQSGQVSGKIDEKSLLAIIKRVRGAGKKEYRIIK